jgi:hypothetical protein
VPTIAESGVPGFDAVGWTMICAPFAWPGVGHVAKQGDGFRFYPEEIRWSCESTCRF